MSIEIRPVDPHDERALRSWWEVGAEATRERPGRPWPLWEVSRAALTTPDPERELTLLGAHDGATLVGSAVLHLSTQDNLHAAEAEVGVVPARRRQGTGTALLAEVEERARAAGRTTVLAEAYAPPGETGAAAFWQRRGYVVATEEAIKRLDLATYAERRAALLDRVGDAADGYRLVTFDTDCPDELLDGYARLLGQLMSEIPLGDLDLQASEWSPERVRAAARRFREIGRHVLTALAVAEDGSVAGCSDTRVNDADTTHGDVGITLVDPAHRGHRLGLRLKVATHDLLVATHPECEALETSNAAVNTHMNAINELIGYRTTETLLELQKVL